MCDLNKDLQFTVGCQSDYKDGNLPTLDIIKNQWKLHSFWWEICTCVRVQYMAEHVEVENTGMDGDEEIHNNPMDMIFILWYFRVRFVQGSIGSMIELVQGFDWFKDLSF